MKFVSCNHDLASIVNDIVGQDQQKLTDFLKLLMKDKNPKEIHHVANQLSRFADQVERSKNL